MPHEVRHISESITVAAPIERCFALSTRIELVRRTLGMKPVESDRPGSLVAGHITAGSRVHWRGIKFGLPTHHHTLITGYAAPHAGHVGDPAAQYDGQPVAWFEDSQEKGRFASFRHVHLFSQQRDHVLLEDHVYFALPFGLLGRMAARLLLAPHIRRLARQRFLMIKQLAEGEGSREWVES